MKRILILIFFITSSYIISEPKQLSCKWVDEDILKGLVAQAPENIKKYTKLRDEAKAETDKAMRSYPSLASEYIKLNYTYSIWVIVQESISKKCSENDWYESYSFVFDTNDLKKPEKKLVDLEWLQTCGAKSRKIKEAFMTSSPTTLSISYTAYAHDKYPEEEKEKDIFNVDRKTLKAGIEDSRVYDCELRDLDTSDNQI